MKIRVTPPIILDTVFILVYSIGYVSLLKYVTYAIFPLPESFQLLLFLLFIYVLRFGGKRIRGAYVKGPLVFFLIGLYLWEVFQGLLVGGEMNAILVAVANLLSTYVAYKYMSNIISVNCSINQVIDSYSAYMYYTLFIVFTSSVLIALSILPPFSNPLGVNSLFRTNMETENAVYYFPGYLSVVYPTPSLFLSSFGLPSFSGLSHESQAMFITIYPSLFLLFYRKNDLHVERKVLILFILTTAITTSLTAVVCFILTYILHLLWKMRVRGQYKSTLLILFFIILVAGFVVTSQFNNIINEFVLGKANFDTVGSSGAYSVGLLSYVVSPTGFLGKGIFGSTAEQGMQNALNCGYVSSILVLSFLLYFIYTCIKNIFSERLLCHAIGLAAFYFIAHSFKYGIQLFNNNYLFFIVFLLAYAEKIRRISQGTPKGHFDECTDNLTVPMINN